MISSHSAALAGLFCLLLGGCAFKQSTPTASGLPTVASFYVCTPTDNAGDARSIEIDPDAVQDDVILKVGSGRPQHLDTVTGGTDRLFANAAYALRLSSPEPRLTDIVSFQIYRCAAR